MEEARAGPDALVDALVEIADDLDLDATLRRTVTTARELSGARYAALGVLDSDGTTLARFLHDGLDEEQADAIGHLPTGRGLLGEVIRHPQPLRVDDVPHHPASVSLPAAHPPVDGFLGVPVRVGSEVFGNLYLTGKPAGFTADDERLLQALALVAGSAIRNADTAARLTSRALLQRSLAQLATEALAGADRDELLGTVEVAATALLPGAVGTVVDDRAAPGPPGDVDTWTVRIGETTDAPRLVLDTSGVSPWRVTDEAHEALTTLCRQAGIAIGMADARAEVRRLAVASERDRIARDLHDTVIQRLFGTGLQLDALTRRLADDEVPAVEHAIEEIDAAIAELRSTIGQLSGPAPADLSDRLEAVVAAIAPACPGLAPLVIDGDPRAVPTRIAEDLPAVLREGITNAARHSSATTIAPRVTIGDDLVAVVVRDDGIGPAVEVERPDDLPPTSLGLRNLAARAARHGGTCRLTARGTGGSELRWRVPTS